ncbi:hypothetical protein [Embleya sp. NPDC005971]|uniref:hypothetical protein n=1 Tax=Embleya sp. NPDC005971 TaxID=3156724 RepID=UPI0033F46784
MTEPTPEQLDNLLDHAHKRRLGPDEVGRIREGIANLRQQLAEYEAAISFETTCLNCTRQTTAAYQDTMRAEQAEAAVQRVRDLFAYWTREFGDPAAIQVEEAVQSVINGTHRPIPGGAPWAWPDTEPAADTDTAPLTDHWPQEQA